MGSILLKASLRRHEPVTLTIAEQQGREIIASLDRLWPRKTPLSKSYGQIAFEAYNESRGGVNYQGLQTPPWPELTEGIRVAWEKAAEAIRS
jgi:hypothetical protein